MSQSRETTRRSRSGIGEVKFPIEVLLEARAARHNCLQVEAILEKEARRIEVIKSPSHGDVMGKDPV